MINKDFQSGDIEEIKDIDSWGECGIFMHFCVFTQNIFDVAYVLGLKCQEEEKCLWFSWFDLTYNDSSKQKTCFLKDKRPYGMHDSTGVISGATGCNDIRGIVIIILNYLGKATLISNF